MTIKRRLPMIAMIVALLAVVAYNILPIPRISFVRYQIVGHDLPPLHAAMNRKAPIEELERLVKERPADINREGTVHGTPLTQAIWERRAAVVEMLCEHGADPNQFVTSYIFEGETPLHVASGEGYREIVEILIKHGADPSLKSWSGKNAATIARHRDHNHLADWLETVHPTSQDNQ